jgi:hypothetical protein
MKTALLYKAADNIEKIHMFDEHYNRNVYLEDGERYIHSPGDEIKGIKMFRRAKRIKKQ